MREARGWVPLENLRDGEKNIRNERGCEDLLRILEARENEEDLVKSPSCRGNRLGGKERCREQGGAVRFEL